MANGELAKGDELGRANLWFASTKQSFALPDFREEFRTWDTQPATGLIRPGLTRTLECGSRVGVASGGGLCWGDGRLTAGLLDEPLSPAPVLSNDADLAYPVETGSRHESP
jgi:hypothetical protein